MNNLARCNKASVIILMHLRGIKGIDLIMLSYRAGLAIRSVLVRASKKSFSEAAKVPVVEAKPAQAPIAKKSSGVGFFGRINSFLTGVGVASIATYYFIYQELVESNADVSAQLKTIQERLRFLEAQK